MELIDVFNLETGKVGKIRRDWFSHPVINRGVLVEAKPGQKPYIDGMYTSRVEEEQIEEAEAAPEEEKED